MKRIVLFLVCLSLTLPAVSGAAEPRPGQFSALKDIDDYLAEIAAGEAAAEPADRGVDLDEEGQKTYRELLAWAEKNPEEFARMVAEDEAIFGPAEAEVESAEESEMNDPGSYCPEVHSDMFTWEARSKKKKRGSGRGARCTAAALRTNIDTCCLLFVRTKLGLPPNPRSVHARDYGPVLTSHGYCTFRGGPDAAPIGAVLVYSGGPSGHIERKIGANQYWFGPTNTGPATEWVTTKRYLKAIYVKCQN